MSRKDELELFMTPEKVKEIMGEPHETTEADERGDYYYIYQYQRPDGYEVCRVKFVDGTVSYVQAWGQEKSDEPEEEDDDDKVIQFPESRVE